MMTAAPFGMNAVSERVTGFKFMQELVGLPRKIFWAGHYFLTIAKFGVLLFSDNISNQLLDRQPRRLGNAKRELRRAFDASVWFYSLSHTDKLHYRAIFKRFGQVCRRPLQFQRSRDDVHFLDRAYNPAVRR